MAVGISRFGLLDGYLRPLPRGFRNLTSVRAVCHRQCLSLVAGTRDGGHFIRHSRVVTFLHHFLSRRRCARIRAPVLRPVPNNTTTHPFIARRGTLSTRFCLHVTPRLCLGQLIINNVRQICRVGEGFEGRNVSAHRGPRFAVLRCCATGTSCIRTVSFLRLVLQSITRRMTNALRLSCKDRLLSFNGPFRQLSVGRTIVACNGLARTSLTPRTVSTALSQRNLGLSGTRTR